MINAEAGREKPTRPLMATRGFATLHIEIFEQILLSGKTNRDLNLQFGYTRKSHCVVDHSRKVMYKLLALESLTREEHKERIINPRKYKFWWMKLLNTHREFLLSRAIKTNYY
jgi:hypothetical protein